MLIFYGSYHGKKIMFLSDITQMALASHSAASICSRIKLVAAIVHLGDL